jgi:hypothetical protein
MEPGKHRIQKNPEYSLSFHAEADKIYHVKVSAVSVRPVVVSGDEGRKAMSGYALIDESDEPIPVAKRTARPADKAGAPSIETLTAAPVRSDIDDLPQAYAHRRKNAYAVIIGIENYRQTLPRADFAVQDARLVSAYLVRSLGVPEENIVLLLNDRALKSDFEKYFEKMAQRSG